MDQKQAKEAAEVLEADYYGPDNIFDINKDLENGNMTLNDFKNAKRELDRLIKKSPQKKHFGLIVVSGHGMIDGKSNCILLNEFDELKTFYKLYPIETQVRRWASKHKSAYFVLLFGADRDIYRNNEHAGCITK